MVKSVNKVNIHVYLTAIQILSAEISYFSDDKKLVFQHARLSALAIARCTELYLTS